MIWWYVFYVIIYFLFQNIRQVYLQVFVSCNCEHLDHTTVYIFLNMSDFFVTVKNVFSFACACQWEVVRPERSFEDIPTQSPSFPLHRDVRSTELVTIPLIDYLRKDSNGNSTMTNTRQDHSRNTFSFLDYVWVLSCWVFCLSQCESVWRCFYSMNLISSKIFLTYQIPLVSLNGQYVALY